MRILLNGESDHSVCYLKIYPAILCCFLMYTSSKGPVFFRKFNNCYCIYANIYPMASVLNKFCKTLILAMVLDETCWITEGRGIKGNVPLN